MIICYFSDDSVMFLTKNRQLSGYVFCLYSERGYCPLEYWFIWSKKEIRGLKMEEIAEEWKTEGQQD